MYMALGNSVQESLKTANICNVFKKEGRGGGGGGGGTRPESNEILTHI